MDAGHELRVPRVLLVVLEEQLPGLLVQGRLRERLDQEAPDHQEHVPDAEVGLPVFLKDVDADVALLCYVGVEYLCEEVACSTAQHITAGALSADACTTSG